MRLNNKFLNESLAGSEALKLEDWGAFNTEFQSCLGFQGVGAAEGSRVSFVVFGFGVSGQRLLTASGLFPISTVSSLSRDCPTPQTIRRFESPGTSVSGVYF